MHNRDYERQQYEDWRSYGRERGFFDRASDEVRSWFGDEDAERRRRMDEQMYGSRRGGGLWGREDRERRWENERPSWQNRDYSGPSPRGSEVEERGRYDMDLGGRRRRMEMEREERMGMFGGGEQYGRYGSEMYGGQRFGRGGYRSEGRPFYDRGGNRDFESGMGWGTERFGRERDWDREQGWDSERRGGFFPEREERGGFFGPREERGGFFSRGLFGDRDRDREERGIFAGSHRGRGPRNYQRSDERILDEVNQLLTFHPEVDATDIDVLVDKGVVTLRGKVDTRHTKRLAEDLVEDVYGVREVRNELRVETGLFNRPVSETPGSQRGNLINR